MRVYWGRQFTGWSEKEIISYYNGVRWGASGKVEILSPPYENGDICFHTDMMLLNSADVFVFDFTDLRGDIVGGYVELGVAIANGLHILGIGCENAPTHPFIEVPFHGWFDNIDSCLYYLESVCQ